MKWIDVEDIAERLNQKYPEIDVMKMRFTDLHQWIITLAEFQDEPTKSNEKILEAIQAEWLSLKV